MQRDFLLKQLCELDFQSLDIGLYLDTHPNDKEAIALYNKIVSASDNIRIKYESNFGPLCSFRSSSGSDSYSWVKEPWPWEKGANFAMR